MFRSLLPNPRKGTPAPQGSVTRHQVTWMNQPPQPGRCSAGSTRNRRGVTSQTTTEYRSRERPWKTVEQRSGYEGGRGNRSPRATSGARGLDVNISTDFLNSPDGWSYWLSTMTRLAGVGLLRRPHERCGCPPQNCQLRAPVIAVLRVYRPRGATRVRLVQQVAPRLRVLFHGGTVARRDHKRVAPHRGPLPIPVRGVRRDGTSHRVRAHSD